MNQLDRLRARLPASTETSRGTLMPQHATRTRSDADGLIIEALSRLGADHVDSEDEISGIWENGLFFFGTLGDPQHDEGVFYVRGTWERAVRADELPGAQAFANDWNAQHIWPKVFVLDDEADVLLHGEVVADLGPDSAVGQVENLITTAIRSALEVFRAAEVAFPDARLLSEARPEPLD